MPISIEVIPLGPVAVGARAWRHRGRRLLTAIVKASFTIHHDGPMTVTQPAPVVTEERHYRNNPVASLVRASDLALLVPKPEVVVVGHAYAAPGHAVQNTTVRLAVARGSTMLINKRLDIIGDRRARPGEPPPDPATFEKIPVLYERARGGISSRENPVGVGLATDPDGLLTFPNVQLPPQGGVAPAGLGPMPSAWPLRQKKRGSLSWSAANASPDVDVPDDFDDAYFQTAPADQQVTDLRGGELIAIVNMHPEIATLRAHLPSARGVALAQTATGERIALALRIDTVHIQPDMLRAEVVYRGATVIAEEKLQHLRLAGALEEPEAPFAFPDLSTVSGLVALPNARAAVNVALDATAVITEEPPPDAQRGRSISTQPPRGHAGTMIIEPDAPAKPAAAAPAPEAQRPKTPQSSTLVLEPEFEPKSLPFDRKKGKGGTAEMNAGPRPGADGTPWGKPDPVKVRPAKEQIASTLDAEDTEDASGFDTLADEETLLRGRELVGKDDARVMMDELTARPASSGEVPTPRAPEPPAQVLPPPPPPPAEPERARVPPPPEQEPPRAPEPARPAPKTNVVSDLYKRFKK